MNNKFIEKQLLCKIELYFDKCRNSACACACACACALVRIFKIKGMKLVQFKLIICLFIAFQIYIYT